MCVRAYVRACVCVCVRARTQCRNWWSRVLDSYFIAMHSTGFSDLEGARVRMLTAIESCKRFYLRSTHRRRLRSSAGEVECVCVCLRVFTRVILSRFVARSLVNNLRLTFGRILLLLLLTACSRKPKRSFSRYVFISK